MDNITSFDIRLENNIYYPGEFVTGCVILENNKDIRMLNIVTALRGKAVAHLKTVRGGDKRVISDYQYLLNQKEVVFGKEQAIEPDTISVGKSDRKISEITPIESVETFVLEKGEHKFDFGFHLPKQNLPCSLETRNCTIRYYIKVIINITKNSSPQGIKYISIIGPHIDCMEDKYMENILSQDYKLKCLSLCQRGSVCLRMNLRRCGYVGGERIEARAEVVNNQNHANVEIRIDKGNFFENKLIQSLVLEYRSPEISENVKYTFDTLKEDPIMLPVLPPTLVGACRLIQIYYILKVCIEDENQKESLEMDFPLVIGTIPYRYPPSTKGVISYEFCAPFIEGGRYISPEFQLLNDYHEENESEKTGPTILSNNEEGIEGSSSHQPDGKEVTEFDTDYHGEAEANDQILYRPVYVKYNENSEK